MAGHEATQYYPLSALPLDESGAVPIEAIDDMVITGQAEQAALSGLGWLIKCRDPRHHHAMTEGVALVGEDRRVKIGAACAKLHPPAIIPTQPGGYEPHPTPQHTA